MVPPPSQNTVGFCNQITPLILYYISSRLVTLLKVTEAPIQVRNIFYLTVSLKFCIIPTMQTELHFLPQIEPLQYSQLMSHFNKR